MESIVDKCFDRFELYTLQNTLAIPAEIPVVLPQYQVSRYHSI